jgi:TM2 domain-containing membrane protein YozV
MDKPQTSKEKKLTLFLLCWLFGLLAIHRFYVGKYLTGSLQLLTLGFAGVLGLLKLEILPAISLGLFLLWWIIDFMLIIMGKFTDKEGRPIVDWV